MRARWNEAEATAVANRILEIIQADQLKKTKWLLGNGWSDDIFFEAQEVIHVLRRKTKVGNKCQGAFLTIRKIVGEGLLAAKAKLQPEPLPQPEPVVVQPPVVEEKPLTAAEMFPNAKFVDLFLSAVKVAQEVNFQPEEVEVITSTREWKWVVERFGIGKVLKRTEPEKVPEPAVEQPKKVYDYVKRAKRLRIVVVGVPNRKWLRFTENYGGGHHIEIVNREDGVRRIQQAASQKWDCIVVLNRVHHHDTEPFRGTPLVQYQIGQNKPVRVMSPSQLEKWLNVYETTESLQPQAWGN